MVCSVIGSWIQFLLPAVRIPRNFSSFLAFAGCREKLLFLKEEVCIYMLNRHHLGLVRTITKNIIVQGIPAPQMKCKKNNIKPGRNTFLSIPFSIQT